MPQGNAVEIEIKGLTELDNKLKRLGKGLKGYMENAAVDSGKFLFISDKGQKTYPPSTAANQPPTPYYIRGTGMQRAGRIKPEYNDGKSERLGSQFHVDKVSYGARISNRASYAKYVIGNEQSQAMAKIGWKKLPEFAKSKIGDIKKIFDGWIKKAIKDAGL